MKKIAVIGTGYVGLVSGVCLSEFGHDVICMDVNKDKIDTLISGDIPIYEPGLNEIVERNHTEGRLHYTTDYSEAVKNSEIIFIAVGTPPQEDGSADLQHVISAARSIAENMDGYRVIVDKSTVPVGTGRKVIEEVQKVLDKRGVDYEFDVVSNPEFLREGSAIVDFMHPDRIVIGAQSERATKIMSEVYHSLYLNNHPFVFTNIETAEVIKYASNAFLATKISFINEIANLCEAVGADVQSVSRGMGLDNRVGKYFLHAGPGYGGSCFPKDTSALAKIGDEHGVDMSIVKTVVMANNAQKLKAVEKIHKAIGDIFGKKIAVLGLSFKPETDDTRESPAITIIEELTKLGAKVKVFDPIAESNVYDMAKNEYEAMTDADALVIVTEWNKFRNLDINKVKSLMKGNYFFDLRNIYAPEIIKQAGFLYYGTGR